MRSKAHAPNGVEPGPVTRNWGYLLANGLVNGHFVRHERARRQDRYLNKRDRLGDRSWRTGMSARRCGEFSNKFHPWFCERFRVPTRRSAGGSPAILRLQALRVQARRLRYVGETALDRIQERNPVTLYNGKPLRKIVVGAQEYPSAVPSPLGKTNAAAQWPISPRLGHPPRY